MCRRAQFANRRHVHWALRTDDAFHCFFGEQSCKVEAAIGWLPSRLTTYFERLNPLARLRLDLLLRRLQQATKRAFLQLPLTAQTHVAMNANRAGSRRRTILVAAVVQRRTSHSAASRLDYAAYLKRILVVLTSFVL